MKVLTALTLLVGCPSPEDDGGPVDTGLGPDNCALETASSDGGLNLGPCNPADGTRCEVSAGKQCVWQFRTDQGACRCLGDAPKAREEVCDEPVQDCAPGLACLPIEAEPKCYQVCTLGADTECDPLSTPDDVFACFPLGRQDGSPTTTYGLCAAAGAPCTPVTDECAATDTCTFVTSSLTACRPSGTAALGARCSAEQCAKGGLCTGLVDGNGMEIPPTCYQPCDPNSTTCSMGTCTDVGLDGYGLCL